MESLWYATDGMHQGKCPWKMQQLSGTINVTYRPIQTTRYQVCATVWSTDGIRIPPALSPDVVRKHVHASSHLWQLLPRPPRCSPRLCPSWSASWLQRQRWSFPSHPLAVPHGPAPPRMPAQCKSWVRVGGEGRPIYKQTNDLTSNILCIAIMFCYILQTRAAWLKVETPVSQSSWDPRVTGTSPTHF